MALAVSGTVTFGAVITPNDTADTVIPGDGRCSLREAVLNANLPIGGDVTAGDCTAGDPGPDTIQVPPATFTLGLAAPPEDANLAGDLDILDHVRISGAGPGSSVIDGGGIDRVLDLAPGGQVIDVELVGLSLVGGVLPAGAGGGGVQVGRMAVTVARACEVSNNRADRGGGIANDGLLFVHDSRIVDNHAVFADDGGGLHNRGDAEIHDSTLTANTSAARGAGAFNAGQLFVQNTHVEFNRATDSGGGLYNDGVAELIETNFGVNDTQVDGGSIFHAGGFMTIERGIHINNGAVGNGGSIASSADIEIRGAELLGNIAFVNGGAIFHVLGQLNMSETTLTQNLAGLDGGGIYNRAAVEARRSTWITNQGGQRGGGIYNAGTVLCEACDLDTNFSVEGGGLYDEGFTNIVHSLLAFNLAQTGAGIFVAGPGQTDVHNSTLSGNNAQDRGGALFVAGGSRLDFTSVIRNEASGAPSGGLHNVGAAAAKNTIFAANSGDCLQLGAFVSFGYNTDSDGTCALGGGPADLPGVNPNVGPLQNNGGPTRTHALLVPSPAIDTADPACLDQAGVVVTRDQRFMPRPLDGDGNGSLLCDRGAYETALPSGPIPPVPDGTFGFPMRARPTDPSAVDIELEWDTGLCPAPAYHLIYGDLSTLSSYAVSGSVCGLSLTGVDLWINSPPGSIWFLIVSDDGVQTEGSWGDATSGPRNGLAPSGQCSLIARDNSGTCP